MAVSKGVLKYVGLAPKVLLTFMYRKAKEKVKLKLTLAVLAILVFGYAILTSKPPDNPPPDNPPDNSAKSADAPPSDNSANSSPPGASVAAGIAAIATGIASASSPANEPSAQLADAQKPDVPEAYDITVRCEDTTGITMVSVDTVKGTVKSGKVLYKDGDTRVSADDGRFPPGCTVRDIVRVTDSTILFGTENVVGTCDAIKDSGTGRFVTIDRLSGVVVISLSVDDAKAGVGNVDGQKYLCQKWSAANGF